MLQAGNLKWELRELNEVLVVDLAGEVTLGQETAALRQLLRSKLEENHRRILLNFHSVSFMDSTGIGVLMEAQAHAVGVQAQLRLSDLPSFVEKILRRMALHQILEVYATESEALAGWS